MTYSVFEEAHCHVEAAELQLEFRVSVSKSGQTGTCGIASLFRWSERFRNTKGASVRRLQSATGARVMMPAIA